MLPSRARVSVLIVNYRVYEELDGCLGALATQQDGRLETIVVDNESDPARLPDMATRHPQTRFLPRPDNLGFGAGINEAARHASADLLLIVNPDARITAMGVHAVADYLDSNADVVAVGPTVVFPDMRPQPTGRRFPSALTGLFGRQSLLTRLWPGNPVSRRDLPSREATDAPIEVDWITGTCMLVRARAFRDVGGFDERFFLYWEDADLCQRLRQRGGRIMFLPSVVVIHAAARSSDRALVRSIAAFHRNALRYYARYQRGPSRPIVVPLAAVALFARMMFRIAALPFRR
jgi:GT2 family glycosyltransferase